MLRDASSLGRAICQLTVFLSIYRTPLQDPTQQMNSRTWLPKGSCLSMCELLFMFWSPMPSASQSHPASMEMLVSIGVLFVTS